MQTRLLVVLLLSAALGGSAAEENGNFEDASVRIALKVYDDCSKGGMEFSSCLKRKTITMLDRIGRMDKFSLTEGIALVKTDAGRNVSGVAAEQLLEKNGTRVNDDKLDEMLVDEVSKFVGSRTIQISMPRLMPSTDSTELESARGDILSSFGGGGGGGGGHGGGGGGHGGGGGGGGGGKRKKKKGGMMNGMGMLIAAKMSALMMMAIGGLFLLAKKALITAKIALLISGIIGLKKLFGNKGGSNTRVEDVWASSSGHGGGGGGGGGWQSSGGGWQGGGGGGGGGHGGGWDKKSFRVNSLPYNAYDPET